MVYRLCPASVPRVPVCVRCSRHANGAPRRTHRGGEARRRAMRRMAAIAIALVALLLHAGAANAGAWCAWSDAYTYNCGFKTLDQCRATIFGDSGAWCAPNPYPSEAPRRRQTSHDPIPNACPPLTNEAIAAARAGTAGRRQVAPSIECRFLDPAWSNARAAGSREVNVTWSSRLSLAFEAIAPGNRFEFDPDRILDGNHGSCLEFKSRPGRAYLVNGRRIVAVHQHMPTPLAHSHDEHLDLEIGGRLPLSEYLQYPLLGILVFHRRTLRTFEPADHVFHWYSLLLS